MHCFSKKNICTLLFCISPLAYGNKDSAHNKKIITERTKRSSPSYLPSGNFASLNVTGNESVNNNLSVGGNIAAGNLSVKQKIEIGNNNCHNGSLTVNGNAIIGNNLHIEAQTITKQLVADSIICNREQCDLLSAQLVKTDCLSTLKNASVGGTLYTNEIDPLTSRTTSFSGNVAISDTKKLLVNEINPVKKVACNDLCNQFEEDEDGTITFSGNLEVNDGKILFINNIEPTEDAITTCVNGNLAVTSGHKLLVNEIDPVMDCNEYDYGTTTFSGNVVFSQPVTFLAGASGIEGGSGGSGSLRIMAGAFGLDPDKQPIYLAGAGQCESWDWTVAPDGGNYKITFVTPFTYQPIGMALGNSPSSSSQINIRDLTTDFMTLDIGTSVTANFMIMSPCG